MVWTIGSGRAYVRVTKIWIRRHARDASRDVGEPGRFYRAERLLGRRLYACRAYEKTRSENDTVLGHRGHGRHRIDVERVMGARNAVAADDSLHQSAGLFFSFCHLY